MVPDPYAFPAFVLAIVSLVVAVIGALTGIVALVWQILTRTRGAHRVSVRALPDMMLLAGGRSTGPYIDIEVTNRGAAAVQLRSWSILLPTGNALMIALPLPFPPSPALPHMLEPGTSVSFYSLAKDLENAMSPGDIPKARAVVVLGTGQRIVGKKGQLVPRQKPEAQANASVSPT